MLIHEITEQNFEKELEKGELLIQKKFDKWDHLCKATIPMGEFKEKTAELMKDPTIWSYATLQDKQNVKLRSYYFQDVVMNDRHRFVQCTAANQIGKTWGPGIIKSTHHAIHVNNASVMFISRSENQAKGILDETKWMLKRSDIQYEEFIDDVENRFEYHLTSPDGVGTSVIRVFPPTPSILSFPATMILMDENGFWESKTCTMDPTAYYQQCVEPRTNATKNWKHPFLTMGQIVGITNPNGQNGLAWWLRNNKKFHNYTYCWLANPNNTLEEYNQAREDLPPIRFASVYAAKYMLASGGFITLDQYERFKTYNKQLVIQPGTTLFLGGDLASEEPKSKNTDWSTLYGVIHVKNPIFPQNPRFGLVCWKDFKPSTPREEYYNEILRLKNLPNVHIAKFAYDKPGVGDSVKRDLMQRGILNENQIEPLTYSLPNKSEVYLNMQQIFHQDMIEGCEVPKLKEQILALKVEQPIGSIHIKVHHKTEGIKDDHPDALANALYVAKNYNAFISSEFISSQAPIKAEGNSDYDKVLNKSLKINQQTVDKITKLVKSSP